LPATCMCLVLFTSVVVWPSVRHSGIGSGNEPAVTVAAVQGNVPRLGLDFNSQRRAVLDHHVAETRRLADDVHTGRAPQPQLVVWPEDASDIDPLVNADAAQQISMAADAIGAPILVGTIVDAPNRPPDDPAYTNTVIVWNPGSGPGERHNKQIVQPFGEYLPWPWLFRHLSGFAASAGHFVPGPSTGVVHAAGIPVGVATCWEVIFDRAARESVRNGAQLLAMPSNNATFNRTMSEQQLAVDKVRAVEHDRYVVVAGTVGISAVIAPDGRELARTDFFEPAYLDTQVRLTTALTPATRWAPIVQWVVVLASVGAVFAAILHNGWFRGWFPRPKRRWLPLPKSRAPAERPADPPPDGDEHNDPAESKALYQEQQGAI
jgi:apolipoprotein N-acyltransferase